MTKVFHKFSASDPAGHSFSGDTALVFPRLLPAAPTAWQSRNAPAFVEGGGADRLPCNLFDVAMAPYRWVNATTSRKLASAIVLALVVLLIAL